MTITLTDQQVKQLAVDAVKEYISNQQPSQDATQKSKRYVYGIRGVRELFNVSHVTAQRYKDTFLKPAVMQRGRKIIVDADMALSLYAEEMDANKR